MSRTSALAPIETREIGEGADIAKIKFRGNWPLAVEAVMKFPRWIGYKGRYRVAAFFQLSGCAIAEIFARLAIEGGKQTKLAEGLENAKALKLIVETYMVNYIGGLEHTQDAAFIGEWKQFSETKPPPTPHEVFDWLKGQDEDAYADLRERLHQECERLQKAAIARPAQSIRLDGRGRIEDDRNREALLLAALQKGRQEGEFTALPINDETMRQITEFLAALEAQAKAKQGFLRDDPHDAGITPEDD